MSDPSPRRGFTRAACLEWLLLYGMALGLLYGAATLGN
jgi:hypothetical protein